MQISEREKLLNDLNFVVEKFRMGKIQKMFKYPIWTVRTSFVSRFLHNLLKDRVRFFSTVKLFFCENMYLSYPPNYDIRFYSAYVSSDAEVRLTKFLIKNIKEGDTFFDIGAAQGYYTILVSKLVGNSGKVYSFEPDPFNLQVLMRNKRDNVFIIGKAVSDNVGESDFYSCVFPNLSSLNFGFIKNYPYQKVKVENITLDYFCQLEKVMANFIKIDIEGGEEKALRGSMNLLRDSHPIILMEVWFKPFGESYKNAIEILLKNGFKMFSITDSGELDEIDDLIQYFTLLDEKYRAINDKSPCDNIVFMKL